VTSFNFTLTAAPLEITYFTNHTDFGIRVESVPSAAAASATSLLIDRVKFGDAAEQNIDQTRQHLKLIGQIRGGRDVNGIWGGTNFGTIRKCSFEAAGVALALQSTTVGENEYYPNVHIRNNFFYNNFAKGIEVDFNGQADATDIINNTFIGLRNGDTAVELQPTGDQDNAAVGDDCLNNNIFESFAIGIDQQEEFAEPVFAGICLFNNIDDANHCIFDGDPIDTDPLRVGTTERLAWNSPCINAGTLNVDSTLMDFDLGWDEEERLFLGHWFISDPDIGCTGGGRFAGILNNKPYSVFNNVTLNANTVIDQTDEYEIIGDLVISNGVELSIGSWDDQAEEWGDPMSNLFFLNPSSEITVNGCIRAFGDIDDDPIYFYSRPGFSNWDKVYINLPDAPCEFTGCYMRNGGYNIRAYGSNIQNVPDLFITDCILAEGSSYNLYVSGDIPVTCRDTRIKDSDGTGLYISANENRSTIDNCIIDNNGNSSSEAGVLLSSGSAPEFTRNTITDNYSRGLYLSGSAVIINGEGNVANLIYNNAHDGVAQTTLLGPEVYLSSSANPEINYTNIWDSRNGTRTGFFVYNSSGAANVNFDQNFWGDNEGNPPHGGCSEFDNEANRASFFAGLAVNYGEAADSWVDDYIVGAAWPPQIDDLDNFDLGLTAADAGDYNSAVEYFQQHLSDPSTDRLKVNALNRLLWSWRQSDEPLDSLRSYYGRFSRSHAEDRYLAYAAQRLADYSLVYDIGAEEAVAALSALRDETPSYSDSVSLEMDIAFLQCGDSEGNQVDAVFNYDRRMAELWDLMELEGERPDSRVSGLPTEFALSAPYPNPFNAVVRFSYSLPTASKVDLGVYDLNGRLIQRLINGQQEAGEYRALWNGDGSPAGVYFLHLKAGNTVQTKRMVLVK